MTLRFAAGRALAALLALALLLGLAGDAFAHASLIRASPGDGAMVPTAPARFALTFNEPVAPLVLKLVTPDAGAISLGDFALEGETLSIAAPPGLGNGTYALSWRVVSTDGHPVGGSVVFSIGAPSADGVPGIEDTVDWPVRIALWMAKLLLYAGLFIGIGGAFFTRWIGDAGGRSAAWVSGAALLFGLAAAGLSLGLQGTDALDAGLAAITQGIVWRTGYATSYGGTVAIAAGAMMAGLLALRLDGAAGRAISLLALAGAGAALAASGHASAASPQWLTRPAVLLHAASIAVWAGALLPLAFSLAAPAERATKVLARFSRVIPFPLLPLVAVGIALAVVQMREVGALFTTAYGTVFLIKLALLAPLFALAAVNRFRLTRPAADGDALAARRLRRSICCELVLVLAIFGAAAAWRFTPPPRALADAAAQPASTHIHTEKAMVDLTISPGRAGPVTASIVIMTGEFGPLPAKEVTLTLANPAAGIEPITRPATQPGDGTWQISGLAIPAPGRWSVRIDILISDFEMVRLGGDIDVRR